MDSNKVIIMEVKDDYAIVMTSDFEFIKIKKKKSMTEGQKIYIVDEDICQGGEKTSLSNKNTSPPQVFENSNNFLSAPLNIENSGVCLSLNNCALASKYFSTEPCQVIWSGVKFVQQAIFALNGMLCTIWNELISHTK